jgi:sn-glycerol 3-phosphate transport system ATP-binding protein
MAYGLKIAGMNKTEIAERVGRAANMLELGPYLARKPRALSGGQRQRVAMGRALVRDPAAFLFDEPLSNLDAKLRVQMRLEIKALQRAVGTTSLYVTHDQVEAMTLADRLVVMNGGRAEQIDTPMNVYLKPASVFVAGFIGSPAMNIIETRVGADGRSVLVPGGSIDLEQLRLHLPAVGAPVLFGIRPEHMAVSVEKVDMMLTVAAVETLGADALAHCSVEGGRKIGDLIVRLPGVTSVKVGQQLPVVIDRNAIHLFDPESKRRLN